MPPTPSANSFQCLSWAGGGHHPGWAGRLAGPRPSRAQTVPTELVRCQGKGRTRPRQRRCCGGPAAHPISRSLGGGRAPRLSAFRQTWEGPGMRRGLPHPGLPPPSGSVGSGCHTPLGTPWGGVVGPRGRAASPHWVPCPERRDWWSGPCSPPHHMGSRLPGGRPTWSRRLGMGVWGGVRPSPQHRAGVTPALPPALIKKATREGPRSVLQGHPKVTSRTPAPRPQSVGGGQTQASHP